MTSIPYRTAGNAAAKRFLTPTAACSSDTNLSSTIMRMTGMTDRRPNTHPWVPLSTRSAEIGHHKNNLGGRVSVAPKSGASKRGISNYYIP
jgi:hypothetical protein